MNHVEVEGSVCEAPGDVLACSEDRAHSCVQDDEGALAWGPCALADNLSCEIVDELRACSHGRLQRCEERSNGALSWGPCEVDADALTGTECAELHDVRLCGEQGVQYCVHSPAPLLAWGPCVEDPTCELGDVASCCEIDDTGDAPCVLADGVPKYDFDGCPPPEETCTPLVLVFDDAPVRFSTSEARFDLAGDGTCSSTDWPNARTPWLALDRDGNGQIDSGRELFGSATILADGRAAKDGFAALRELDHDHDGLITPRDADFSSLVLWSDLDNDRRSSPAELVSLAERGVTSIELDYRSGRRCDAHGNCEIERARFSFARGDETRSGDVIDIHLVCQ
ncbi:MAG: hypothetical protein KC468_20775 [Myxococcales bacterium]|nr:hypothetical protein [Myxococcales bacterium]